MFERKALGNLQSTNQPKLMLTGGLLKVSTPTHSAKKRKFIDENSTPGRSDGVYEDPTPKIKRSKPSGKVEIAVQTENYTSTNLSKIIECNHCHNKSKSTESSNQDVVKMLTSDEPSESYWELMAIERKSALVNALQENKRVVRERDDLQEENAALKEENKQLVNKFEYMEKDNKEMEKMIAEAKKLSELVQFALKDESEASGEDLGTSVLCEEEEGAEEDAKHSVSEEKDEKAACQ